MSLIAKLPQYYRSNPNYAKIAEYISSSRCRFSAMLVTQQSSNHLLFKDGSIHSTLDWEAFSLLRASCNMLVSSGKIMRDEVGLFKVREDYGNRNVKELYDNLLGQKRQKLFIFSKQLTPQFIKNELNEALYQLAQLPHFTSVHNAISQLVANPQNLPLTVEMGLDTFHQYYRDAELSGVNHIDTLLLTKFTGDIDKKYIGTKFDVNVDKYYKMEWKSEPLPSDLSNGQKGHLTLQVYKQK